MLQLSKTLDPTDYAQLAQELEGIDSYDFDGHPPQRRWEYALALHAIHRWRQANGRRIVWPIYDVGGAGSPFCHMLTAWTDGEVLVIDPKVSFALSTAVVGEGLWLANIVTCLSVLEHVSDLDQFLYHLGCVLAPGGLLVLTMAFWDKCGKDTAYGHELRERIFCPKTYLELRNTAVVKYHLTPFGGVDPVYHGPQVHDHTVASLVLEKRR